MKETGHDPQGYPGAFRFADDYVVMALQAATQWDALAHVHYDGRLYNGFSASSVGARGARHNAVTNLLPAVTGRAVLLDVAGHRDVPWLTKGEPIWPGLTLDCAPWCHERGIAAVGSDNFAVEVLPGQIEGEALPFHMVALRDMGMPLAEILDLEAFAADCREDGVFEAFFCAAPLPFTAAVGSPVNPIVIK